METLILIIYVLAGILIHIGLKWRDAITQKNKLDWRKHLIIGAIALILNIVLISFKQDIQSLITITKPVAFFMGYFGDSAFKNVTKFYGNKYKFTQ